MITGTEGHKVRLVAIDLDGTLLTDQKTICSRNKAAIQQAVKQGVKIVLCSGRSPEGMKEELKELCLQQEGQFGIGLNGSVIFENQNLTILEEVTMDPEAIIFLLQEERTMPRSATLMISTRQGTLTREWNETCALYEKVLHYAPKAVGDLAPFAGEVIKCMVFSNGPWDGSFDAIQELKAHFMAGLPSSVQGTISAPYLLELFDRQVNKGVGLAKLAQRLGIPIEETMAIGDLENDLPMLTSAGIGIAMQNGSREVKEAADYITEADNNAGGVAEAIEKFVLRG